MAGPQERALALYHEADDAWGWPSTVNKRGAVAYHRGDLDRAEDLWLERLSMLRAIGDTRAKARTSNPMGSLTLQCGNRAGALARLSKRWRCVGG